jgi:hypothetical protein
VTLRIRSSNCSLLKLIPLLLAICSNCLSYSSINKLHATEVASSPVLFFSDLTHAPNRGWAHDNPSRGAAVTVWGRDFGQKRGSNFVTVNNAKLVDDSDYAEWNADSYDIPFLKRITFWINSSCTAGHGKITVTVDGVTSNALSFTVTNGQIYFVDGDHDSYGRGSHSDPWNNPGAKRGGLGIMRPGDILYFRETKKPYSARYLTGHQNFYMAGLSPGLEDAPIALVAYPGEAPEISAMTIGEADSCFTSMPEWWTVSKFKLRSHFYCVMASSTGVRIVGNDCVGCLEYGTGAGIINTMASQHYVYGNSCHGGRSSKKLDHAIYLSGNPTDKSGTLLGWNYIYDNSFDRGPLIIVNHQDKRIPCDAYCKQHRIHSNLIDGRNYPSRGIGIYHMGWNDEQDEHEPEAALIFNNILIGCGHARGAALYALNGKSHWFNNTAIMCEGTVFEVGTKKLLSIHFNNNILHLAEPGKFVSMLPGSGKLLIDHNIWTGAGQLPMEDVHAIRNDPRLEIDRLGIYTLPESSSAIDAGINESLPQFVVVDFNGNPRIQRKRVDCGAIESQDK